MIWTIVTVADHHSFASHCRFENMNYGLDCYDYVLMCGTLFEMTLLLCLFGQDNQPCESQRGPVVPAAISDQRPGALHRFPHG